MKWLTWKLAFAEKVSTLSICKPGLEYECQKAHTDASQRPHCNIICNKYRLKLMDDSISAQNNRASP